jgi:hypothetical protein
VEESGGKLGFNMVIKHHTSKEISMQLSFDDPPAVSQGINRDVMEIRVLNPSVFVSKENFLTIELENQLITKEIPK